MSVETQTPEGLYVLHDADSNLLDTDRDVVDHHNERWGTDYSVEQFTEDMAAWWGVSLRVALDRWRIYCTERLEHIPPVRGAAEAVRNIATLGATQDVLTSRSIPWQLPTQRSINRHFPSIRLVHHANIDWSHPDAPQQTKENDIARLKPDVLTEDQIKHCFAALRCAVPLIILRRTLQNRDLEVPPGITVSRSWSESEDLITEAAERKRAEAA